MTLYYIRSLKIALDLERNIFARCKEKDCPAGTLKVDWLEASPHTTKTWFEPSAAVHMRPAGILYVNGFDLITVITVMRAIGRLTAKQYLKPFLNDPDPAIKATGRAALDLPAAGEDSYFKAIQANAWKITPGAAKVYEVKLQDVTEIEAWVVAE